jgi:hypothetical protein
VIFIWNGLGCLVIPVVIIGGVVMASIAQAEPNIRWPRLIAVLGTALALFGLGIVLNRPQVVGHDRFGNAVTQKGDHSLYWIPIQYWSVIVLIFGTIAVFKK